MYVHVVQMYYFFLDPRLARAYILILDVSSDELMWLRMYIWYKCIIPFWIHKQAHAYLGSKKE